MVKRVYLIKPILVNGVSFSKILIHQNEEFKYYVSKIVFREKWYKIVWLIERNLNYLGIISIFRDRRIK